MPEYLAPGVFVEEVSFRSKSIEGVGTSTTAFAGAARTGPDEGTPELLTSFADFERLYGGLAPLSFGDNYLAHAARAYFNEGGARLYVSRVKTAGASKANYVIQEEADEPGNNARFEARFAGSGGNCKVGLTLNGAPTTPNGLRAAPLGTVARVGTRGTPARPAALTSSVRGRAFALPNGATLNLTVDGGGAIALKFLGAPAEVEGTQLAAQVQLTDQTRELTVEIDGVRQTIVLPDGPQIARQGLVNHINRAMRSGYAELGAGNKLQLGTESRGFASRITVSPNASLGFADGALKQNVADDHNNVANLNAVTVQEIDRMLQSAGGAARLVELPNGEIELRTAAAGENTTLLIGDNSTQAQTALGFPATPDPVIGVAGTTVTYYVHEATGWLDAAGNILDLDAAGALETGAEIVTLSITAMDADGNVDSWDEVALDPRLARSLHNVLPIAPTRRSAFLANKIAYVDKIRLGALTLIQKLFAGASEATVTLIDGKDGSAPIAANYEEALTVFESIEDISIVAAPGAVAYGDASNVHELANIITAHAEKRRMYRIAVLDSPKGETTPGGVREFRGKLIDSTRAALYFPWVVVSNPLWRPGADDLARELVLPPSGYVCGIYARSDITRGVYKAPANEPVYSALRFEADINTAQQEMLNPIGVNCLRLLSGRGYRVWGARTTTSDPEWKYVNIRRYFNYLEASIDRGTQWAVFEPNGERLWANIRTTIEDYLYNEWVSGALLGSTPAEAFFVRCDRTTMTQNDLDNGRLICLIGLAAIKPAEFVIFRIGQKTADARS